MLSCLLIITINQIWIQNVELLYYTEYQRSNLVEFNNNKNVFLFNTWYYDTRQIETKLHIKKSYRSLLSQNHKIAYKQHNTHLTKLLVFWICLSKYHQILAISQKDNQWETSYSFSKAEKVWSDSLINWFNSNELWSKLCNRNKVKYI